MPRVGASRRFRSNTRRITAVAAGVALIVAACGGSSESSEPADSAEPSTSTSASTVPAAPTTTEPAETTPTIVERDPPVVVEVTGPEEVVFDYSEDACGDYQRPDLPARAFRGADGSISVTLAHEENTRLVGPSFDELVPGCEVIRSSSYDHDPAAHAHFEWMAGIHTDDGETIHAVIHNEYHGWEAALADSRRAILNDYGDTGWTYLARTGSGLVDMAPVESGFSLGDTLCAIDFWGAHPDVGCDAMRRYTAPTDGRYVVDVTAGRTAPGGDGVIVSVERDGAPLLSATLDDATTPSLDERLDLELAAGDTLDFVVASGGDSSFDATEYEVVITPDGEVCTADDIFACQHTELTASVSTDGGATFSPSTGAAGVIASPIETYEHDAGLLALWQPSNIVEHPTDGHLYMLVQFDDRQNDRSVQLTCLLRTDDIADPSSWRGYDGDDFTLAFTSPYAAEPEVTEDCWSVIAPPIGGLTWNTHLERFVAIGSYAQFGTNGQYLSTSRDLIEWTRPVLIQPAEFVFTADEPPFEPYATLIDHTSESMSFDTTGATPHLYFTRINDRNTLDFDLVRVPISIDFES